MYDLENLPYPPQMLVGIVAKLEPEFDVAARFGYPSDKYKKLRETAAFKNALAKVQASMADSGLDAESVEHAMLQEMTAVITKELFADFKMRGGLKPDERIRMGNALYNRENQLSQRLTPKNKNTGDSDKFSITIITGGTPTTLVAEGEVIEHEAGPSITIPANPEEEAAWPI